MSSKEFVIASTIWFVCWVSLIIPSTTATCENYLPLHKVISSPHGVHTIKNMGGSHEINAKTYNVNYCNTFSIFETGSKYIGNHTFVGHASDVNTDNCVIKREGERRVYDSMQAIVIKTNGWQFSPTIDVDDIDAEVDTPAADGWRDSAAVLGLLNGKFVTPIIQLHESTVLRTADYVVKASTLHTLGINANETIVRGAEFAASEPMNCPSGPKSEISKKCRMTVSFNSAIDTMVIMYAIAQKSKVNPNSAIFLSELVVPCGCQCSQEDLGPRMISVPILKMPNECERKKTDSLRTQCDYLGNKWCSKKNAMMYEVIGGQLSNKHFPCKSMSAFDVEVIGDFNPTRNFTVTSP